MRLARCQGVTDITKQTLESGHSHGDTCYAARQHNHENDPPHHPENATDTVAQAVEEQEKVDFDAVETEDEQDNGGPACFKHRLGIPEEVEYALDGDCTGVIDPAHQAIDLVREALRETLDAGDEAQGGHHEPVLGEEVSETGPSDVDARREGDDAQRKEEPGDALIFSPSRQFLSSVCLT